MKKWTWIFLKINAPVAFVAFGLYSIFGLTWQQTSGVFTALMGVFCLVLVVIEAMMGGEL